MSVLASLSVGHAFVRMLFLDATGTAIRGFVRPLVRPSRGNDDMQIRKFKLFPFSHLTRC